jgi:hypothetical protein
MEQEGAMAAEGIEPVVVDPDDVIAAFERNRDEDDEQRHRGLRVPPPFEGETRAELHAGEDDAPSPSETESTPIHLPPELFVENYRDDDPERTTVRIPTREGSRSAARSDHGEDVDEETVEEYHETAMDVWKDCVRDSLLDEVRAASDPDTGTEVWVDVRYESNEAE